jgi:hypothetical protein
MTRTSRRRSASSRGRRGSRSCRRRERDGTKAIGPFRQLTWEAIKESAATATSPLARLIAASVLHPMRQTADEAVGVGPGPGPPPERARGCAMIWMPAPRAPIAPISMQSRPPQDRDRAP